MNKLVIDCYNYVVLDDMFGCDTVEEMKKLLKPRPKG